MKEALPKIVFQTALSTAPVGLPKSTTARRTALHAGRAQLAQAVAMLCKAAEAGDVEAAEFIAKSIGPAVIGTLKALAARHDDQPRADRM